MSTCPTGSCSSLPWPSIVETAPHCISPTQEKIKIPNSKYGLYWMWKVSFSHHLKLKVIRQTIVKPGLFHITGFSYLQSLPINQIPHAAIEINILNTSLCHPPTWKPSVAFYYEIEFILCHLALRVHTIWPFPLYFLDCSKRTPFHCCSTQLWFPV